MASLSEGFSCPAQAVHGLQPELASAFLRDLKLVQLLRLGFSEKPIGLGFIAQPVCGSWKKTWSESEFRFGLFFLALRSRSFSAKVCLVQLVNETRHSGADCLFKGEPRLVDRGVPVRQGCPKLGPCHGSSGQPAAQSSLAKDPARDYETMTRHVHFHRSL